MLYLRPRDPGLPAAFSGVPDREFPEAADGTNLTGAFNYFTGALREGTLPGWPKHGHGELSVEMTEPEKDLSPSAEPVYEATMIAKSVRYHCSVKRAAGKDSWKVMRAWQTDARGRVVQEFPVGD